ncbi:hypothetical protein G4O51_03860 [Candidatus Bathyarchaeota archaeon A05DMB-2]|jgi:heme A synthase|nr:hypothetical protein [Candidatus Bathyarchaeota archaeon A05DMB-2]
MTFRFSNLSKTALALGFLSILVGAFALRSELEWHLKVGVLLVSFALYLTIMIFEALVQQSKEQQRLEEVFET